METSKLIQWIEPSLNLGLGTVDDLFARKSIYDQSVHREQLELLIILLPWDDKLYCDALLWSVFGICVVSETVSLSW